MLKIAFHPIYTHPLPAGHRFPMEKYDLLPMQLKHEGTCTEENFFTPGMPHLKHVVAVHDAHYVSDLK
ncbi:MAG: histone deacetylase, partial [Salibacteraceae bacterium]